jgi:hypothetical protein
MAGVQTMATSLKLIKADSEPSDTVLAHLVSIGEQGSEAEEIVVTTLDSPNRAKEFIQGAKDAGTIEVTATTVLMDRLLLSVRFTPAVLFATGKRFTQITRASCPLLATFPALPLARLLLMAWQRLPLQFA